MKEYFKNPTVLKFAAPNANYLVTLAVTANEDSTYTVYSQNRCFHAIDNKISCGETQTLTFVVNVCDYNRRDAHYNVDGVQLQILCDESITASAQIKPINLPTLYILGDSTVTDQPYTIPYVPHMTYCGWGQVLPMLTDKKIAVSNHAESGATTNDARNVHLPAFADKLKEGDFLMVEFGHNDQKLPYLKAYEGYSENLRYFCAVAKEKNVRLILNSPINRIIFDENGKIADLLGEYRNAVKTVAEKENTFFIDTLSATTAFFEPLGLSAAKPFFRYDDTSQDFTHTNDMGGIIIGKLAAKEIMNANITGLSEHILKDSIEIEDILPNKDKEINISHLQAPDIDGPAWN